MALNIHINTVVLEKLTVKHDVTRNEIEECFYNRAKSLLEDTREQHITHPPTLWFISMTDHGRRLKVVFVEHANSIFEIKTAYEPNAEEVRIYEKYA